jgi:hypothetical protein
MKARHAGLLGATLALAVATGAAGAIAGASTPRAPRIAVNAHAHWVLANGTATSKINVHLFGGRGARHAAVTLTTADTPSGGGSCGTLTATTGETGRNGFFSTSYTASSTVGFCTITATSGTTSASTTIDQIDPTLAGSNTHYTVTAAASTRKLVANGTSTSTVTIVVTNGTSPVTGDAILVTVRSWRNGICGNVVLGAPTTDGTGTVTATYTSSTFNGVCVLRAWEAATGSHSKAIAILQRGGTKHHPHH